MRCNLFHKPAKMTDRSLIPFSAPALITPGEGLVDNRASFKEQHDVFLNAATSSNTRRTYQSAIRHFLGWGGMLPADEGTVLRYMVAFADVHNPRTLAIRLTALSRWHVHQGFRDPTTDSTVRKTLTGIAREKGRPRRQAKALPVEDLDQIVAALGRCDTLQAARDSALLQVGFYGGFRRSEVVGICVEHISWEREGVTISLPRSKTDQTGQGIVKAIPFGADPYCPVTALRGWLERSGIVDGPVFRRISRWGQLGTAGLNASSVNDILTAAGSLAQLSYVPALSSHSLRRGMATSAFRAGAGLREIKRQGGWRHDGTVHGYIEEATRFEENAAGTLLGSRTAGRRTHKN
jgi:integrase